MSEVIERQRFEPRGCIAVRPAYSRSRVPTKFKWLDFLHHLRFHSGGSARALLSILMWPLIGGPYLYEMASNIAGDLCRSENINRRRSHNTFCRALAGRPLILGFVLKETLLLVGHGPMWGIQSVLGRLPPPSTPAVKVPLCGPFYFKRSQASRCRADVLTKTAKEYKIKISWFNNLIQLSRRPHKVTQCLRNPY